MTVILFVYLPYLFVYACFVYNSMAEVSATMLTL